MACWRMAWWRANTSGRASGKSCARRVLPSISVKRKVTVPVGGLVIAQRQLNCLVQGHGAAGSPGGLESGFVELWTQSSQVPFVFELVRTTQFRLDQFQTRIYGAKQLRGAPGEAARRAECRAGSEV